MSHLAQDAATLTSTSASPQAVTEPLAPSSDVSSDFPPTSETRTEPPDAAHSKFEKHASGSDEALLGDIAGGDATALAVLYRRTVGLVYANVLRVLDEPKLCNEVTQEIFVDITVTDAPFDSDSGSARHWLLAFAHRRATERLNAGVAVANDVGDKHFASRVEAGGSGTTHIESP